jgi:histidyl-tRNA synthetase
LYKKVRGFRDIFGDEIYYWNFIEKIIYDLSRRYGYSEYKIPVLEKAEVFNRGIGSTTDIVEKEMFIFKDKNDDFLALRPEGTAGMVRGFVENKLYAISGVKKYFYYGPMFRRERPQKGRYRQFYQFGVEAFGSASPVLDSEVIKLLTDFFKECKIEDKLKLEINSIGCPECRPLYKDKLTEYFETSKDELCEDCRRRLNTNPMRILDCKIESCKAIAEKAPVMINYLCRECAQHFESVKTNLSNMNVSFEVNPHMVRGLDYYVRTAFEMVTDEFEANSTVGAGGRYDGLVKQLGGPDQPGIGFAVGIDRLVGLMESKDVIPQYHLDIFFVLPDGLLDEGVKIINNIREKGYSVDMDFDLGSVKSQMKKANRFKAKLALIFGQNELDKKSVTIKDMDKGNQELVPFSRLMEKLSIKLDK